MHYTIIAKRMTDTICRATEAELEELEQECIDRMQLHACQPKAVACFAAVLDLVRAQLPD